MEHGGVEPPQALQTTPVKSSLPDGALSTPPKRDPQPTGGSNGDYKTDEPKDVWPGSVSPKVTRTYGKKNKGRARDRANVSTPTASTRLLLRTHSSAALKGEISKETPISKSVKKKRNRSPSPTVSKSVKHHRTLSAPVKRSISTSNLREAKRARKPTAQRTSTEPTKKETHVEYTLHLDSDLSDLESSLSRSGSPKSDVKITKGPTPPPPSFPSQGSSKSAISSTSRPIKPRPPKFRTVPSGSSSSLPAHVWVLIDPKTGRVSDHGQERLWWPGKILSKDLTSDPLKVQLLNLKSILVTSPNEEKILSWLDSNNKQRFKEPTFHDPDVESSPRRKSKGQRNALVDLERSWWAAVSKMGVDAEDSDELPDVRDMFTHASTPSLSTASRAISEEIFISATPSTAHEIWEDPGPDPSFNIPGELVFGRDREPLLGKDAATSVEHWAAKILDYIPSTKRKKPGMYKIIWMSGETKNLSRNWFYVLGQPEFYTCKLGKIDSSGGAEQEPDISGCDFLKRSPSPEPAQDAPTGFKFLKLSLRQQFSYVKPVLSAILKNEYVPLRELQAEYFSGATKNWNEHSSRRGSITDDHVETLSIYLKEWVLRPTYGDRAVREETPTPLPEEERHEDTKREVVAQVPETEDTEHVDEIMHKPQDGPSEPSALFLEHILEVKVTKESDETMDDIQHEPCEPLAQLSTHTNARAEKEDDSEPELNTGSRSSSPPMTEAMSSPGPFPPSSSFISVAESNDSFMLESTARAEVDDAMSTESSKVPVSPLTEFSSAAEAAPEESSNLMIVDDDDTTILSTQPEASLDTTQQPLKHDAPVPAPRPTPPRQYGSVEYENLHPLKKIIYISDVLLVELLRQVLLWRAGERSSSNLLDSEEEQKLFDVGEPLLESDWVVDLMRQRESRTGDVEKSTSTGIHKNSNSKGSGRLRTKKRLDYRENN